MHGFTWLTSLEMLIYPRTGYVSTVVMNGGEAMKVSMDNNGAAWWVTIREPVGMPGVVTRFEYLAARDRAPRQGKRPDKR